MTGMTDNTAVQIFTDEAWAVWEPLIEAVIPTLIDYDRWAHWRNPSDMMRQGWAISSFHAAQQ